MEISGVILAGGENRRFGGNPKTDIEIGGKTIISRMIETIGDIFDDLIIVTNNPENFSNYSQYRIVSDIFLKAGPLGGLHAAMKASSKKALFAFAGDMPFLEKQMITDQIKIFMAEKCDAVVPVINNNIEPLHSIYNNNLLYRLEKYLKESDDLSVHNFLSQLEVNYLRFTDSEKAARSFTNINSLSELDKIEKMNGS
jgi:molybdopterin-guanine dinucleotide biosynthesis protein A